MLVRIPQPGLRFSSVTPKPAFLNRRRFLSSLGATGLGLSAAGAAFAGVKLPNVQKSAYRVDEKLTPFEAVAGYNNFYEFGTGKEDPAQNAKDFRTSPWTVSLEGEVLKKKTLDLDAIRKLAPLEERIYRHRCVEAWSMVVPWVGFPLSALLKQVEPTAKAKFVAFESYFDPGQMPLARLANLPFPYVEGLRLDEAMHPLTLLTAGLYGEVLPNQNGAPFRLIVPWKYGFKGIKSIVRIRFTEKQPPTTWNRMDSVEYGFYSNVNPTVDHRRWTQAKERRIGEFFKRDTLMFNGYEKEVASLYAGMDLKKHF